MNLRITKLLMLLVTITTLSPLWSQIVPAMKLIGTIPVPNVEGYFDHMAVDVQGQRLFVPAEHQRQIEVVDLKSNQVSDTITGFGGDPRRIVYIPQTNEIWVDDGDDTCKAFSGVDYKLIKTLPLADHDLGPDSRRVPDNAAFDDTSGLFYIATRTDSLNKPDLKGSIEIVDIIHGRYLGSIPLNVQNPAGIAIDPRSSKMYVVSEDTSEVLVVDRDQRRVLATWPIVGGPEPHAVAIDSDHRRLFVGSRVKRGHLYKPGKLVIIDVTDGKVTNTIDTEGGVDEVVWEPKTRTVFYTGTTGFVDLFSQVDADHYRRIDKVPTGALAKTTILVPELKRFYAAVPKHIILTPPIPQSKEATVEGAKIMVYELQN